MYPIRFFYLLQISHYVYITIEYLQISYNAITKPVKTSYLLDRQILSTIRLGIVNCKFYNGNYLNSYNSVKADKGLLT